MTTNYTATDLRNQTCTHDQFYSQFVTLDILQLVGKQIGIKRIRQSTDPHFNDIPLQKWDRLSDSMRNLIDAKLWKQLYNTTYRPQDQNNFIWSLSCGVCIAKAAARIIKNQ